MIENYKNLEDSELAIRSLSSSLSFMELMKRYEKPLLRYIKRISFFQDSEAEDILQEVFIKVYKNLNNYDSSLKFSSWIYRITHNQTVDNIRKNSKNESVPILDDDWGNIIDKFDLHNHIESSEIRNKIILNIENLPIKYKEILYLRFLEEKSYEEISDIIKIPKGTVSTLINRGKKILQQKLNNI